MTGYRRYDPEERRRIVARLSTAVLVAVGLGCWLALARVLGTDPRFIVLSVLAWALVGTILTLIAGRGGRGGSVGDGVAAVDARRTDPEVRDATARVPPACGLEAELERLRCRNRVELRVGEGGLCRISCATAMRVGQVEDLERVLSSVPTGAGWRSVWSALFDHPEVPNGARDRDR